MVVKAKEHKQHLRFFYYLNLSRYKLIAECLLIKFFKPNKLR